MVPRPLVVITCLFIIGILLAGELVVSCEIAMLTCGLFFVLTGAGYILAWRGNRWVFVLLILALGFAFGRLSALQVNPTVLNYAGHWVTIEGMVCSEPDVRSDKVLYKIDISQVALGKEHRNISARALIQTPAPGPVYSYGDCLSVHGLLTLPEEPGNPGAFNYRSYLLRQGIGVILKTQSDKDIARLGIGGNPVTRWLLNLKEKMLMANKETLPSDEAALVNGIVFGAQGEIPRHVWQIFSETGIVHILSVSGMHVGLVMAGVMATLTLLRFPSPYLSPVTSLILVFYALLSGLGPAVTRATLMALLFLWAHHWGRRQDWPTTLALAALVNLVWKPQAVYDIGFQLSFAATWGILYLGPVLERLLKNVFRWPAWLRAVIWVSLAAQLATLPLVAMYYNIVSPVSLLANLVAAPITGFILALGAAASILGIFSTALAGLVNASTSLLLNFFLKIASLMHVLPGAVIYVRAPSIFFLPIWYALLGFGAELTVDQKMSPVKNIFSGIRRLAGIIILVTSLLLVFFVTRWPAPRQLVVHMIDVGQGESILVQTPAGKNMLIDAGGWDNELESGQGAGSKVVVPYLRRLGVHSLDVLMITHSHEDHAGGVRAVVQAFPVALAIMSPECLMDKAPAPIFGEDASGEKGKNNSQPDRLFTQLLNARVTSIKTVGAGDSIELDPEVEMQILGPPRPLLKGTNSDANNGSIVLFLRYGQQTFLLTGDIELEAQQWLLSSGANLKAHVLKVPHHGSQLLLKSFIDKVQPSIALISVGSNNRFNLPSDKSVEMLNNNGTTIYRTDNNGAIILITDGKKLQVETGRR